MLVKPRLKPRLLCLSMTLSQVCWRLVSTLEKGKHQAGQKEFGGLGGREHVKILNWVACDAFTEKVTSK